MYATATFVRILYFDVLAHYTALHVEEFFEVGTHHSPCSKQFYTNRALHPLQSTNQLQLSTKACKEYNAISSGKTLLTFSHVAPSKNVLKPGTCVMQRILPSAQRVVLWQGGSWVWQPVQFCGHAKRARLRAGPLRQISICFARSKPHAWQTQPLNVKHHFRQQV